MPQISIRKNFISEEIFEEEETSIQMILTHFDDIRGPMIFMASPPKVSEGIEKFLIGALDLNLPEGFFENKIQNEDITLGNYIFELDSDWARGKSISLMLTMVLKTNQKFNRIKQRLLKIVSQLINLKNGYKAFYGNSKRDDPEILEKKQEITKILFKSTEFLGAYIDHIKMGKVLVVGTKYSGKTSFINCLIADHIDSISDFSKIENKNLSLDTDIKKSGKLILDYFIEMSEIWVYDLDETEIPFKMWFQVCKDPILIILVLDLTKSKEEQKVCCDLFGKVLNNYLSEYSSGFAYSKTPVIVLANKRDQQVTFNESEFNMQMKFEQYQAVSRIFYISTTIDEGIEDALKWGIKKLLSI
jgi:GTPase SAR1 family protein